MPMTHTNRSNWLLAHWVDLTAYEREVLAEKIQDLRDAEEALDATMEGFTVRLIHTAATKG